MMYSFIYFLIYLITASSLAFYATEKKPGSGGLFFMLHCIIVGAGGIGCLSAAIPVAVDTSDFNQNFAKLCQMIPGWMIVGSFFAIMALFDNDSPRGRSYVSTSISSSSKKPSGYELPVWCYGHTARNIGKKRPWE